MTEKTFMAGFGGQGVISLGQLWVYCGMKEGLNVTFFPFYGAEKRGGIARASVIISSEDIASPLVTQAHSVVVMNQDSLSICEKLLIPGGVMLVNSTLIKALPTRSDIRVVRVPCNEIADSIGDTRVANLVMMGALARITGAVNLEHLPGIMRSFFPASKVGLIPMNIAAIEAGENVVS